MERCSAKDLEEMKAAEAIAAEEEMKATDFVVAYKRLPKREIEFILAHGRIPVDKRCSTVLREVSHEGRLIGGVARDRNRMVTQGAETAI